MDTEQLKMVLDALAAMGEGGKEAFIYWLVFTELTTPVAWIAIIAVLTFGALRALRHIRESMTKANKERERQTIVWNRLHEMSKRIYNREEGVIRSYPWQDDKVYEQMTKHLEHMYETWRQHPRKEN